VSVRARIVLCAGVLTLLSAAPVAARPPSDDAERAQRRSELRQQLEGERERWRGGPGRDGPPGQYRPLSPGPHGPNGPHGPPGSWGGVPPERAVPPGPGPDAHRWRGSGGDDGHRLSPEERRALRQELRRQRP
jgi:hypothetical protein